MGRQQVAERHQRLLHGVAVGLGKAGADLLDFGLAARGVRMFDGVAGTLAAPAGRQFHVPDVEVFVFQCRHALFRVAPESQRAL